MSETAKEMIRKMREDSEHLTFWDLPENQRIKLTIDEAVLKKNVTMQNGRKLKEVLFLKFKGKSKMLFLSGGKLKKMYFLHGDVVADWAGKEVVLFADPSVKFKGEQVGGLVLEGVK